MPPLKKLEIGHPSFDGIVGVARRDITPPAGIYSRMWGTAQHDIAEGIHRPLTATVLTIQSTDRPLPLVLVSLDLGWWRTVEDEWFLRSAVLAALSLEESQLMVHLTHTHAGPSISLQSAHKPGGDKVKPYLLMVSNCIVAATHVALASATQANMSWNTGRCNLACHRDQRNPEGPGVLVGYAPYAEADDTLVVGRVTDTTDRVIATLVNYACHPTTLGSQNRLISPDYVGAMREIVERATDDAPCLFLNGAAGELAPRRQYADQTEAADQNGRQLGYAALATLTDMLPPRTKLRFDRIEESAARLGCWRIAASVPDPSCQAQRLELKLRLRDPTRLDQLLDDCDDRVASERVERFAHMWNGFNKTGYATLPVWIWRLGEVIVVGTPAEMHSPFQMELRRRFPARAVVVMNLVNGSYGYLPPKADYLMNTYQCTTSLFEAGCHEQTTKACVGALEPLLSGDKSNKVNWLEVEDSECVYF